MPHRATRGLIIHDTRGIGTTSKEILYVIINNKTIELGTVLGHDAEIAHNHIGRNPRETDMSPHIIG